MEEWNKSSIEKFCTQRGIDWVFNPPGASHMGGVWERMIRFVCQILRALLKEQIICDEVLSTIVAEVTNILTSRPLTRNSNDSRDPDPLTPNHLFHLRPCPSLPPGVFRIDDKQMKRQWRQAQFITNMFWKRWTKEYLACLQRRQKWNELQTNLKVGDLVLLTDGNFPTGQWPLARVVEVVKGRDGLVRSVKIKTCSTMVTCERRKRWAEVKATTTVLERPITKLCRLEFVLK